MKKVFVVLLGVVVFFAVAAAGEEAAAKKSVLPWSCPVLLTIWPGASRWSKG